MIPLHTIKVASPCHADWDKMEGDNQVRFCGGCRKNVYNLSEMKPDEAAALVSRLEGRLCVRFYTRADGTLLTQDCPVGLRAVRRKLVRNLSYAATLLLSCMSGLLRGAGAAPSATPTKKHAVQPHAVQPHAVQPSHTMGKIAWPGHMMGKPLPPPMMHTMGIVSVPPRPMQGAPSPPNR